MKHMVTDKQPAETLKIDVLGAATAKRNLLVWIALTLQHYAAPIFRPRCLKFWTSVGEEHQVGASADGKYKNGLLDAWDVEVQNRAVTMGSAALFFSKERGDFASISDPTTIPTTTTTTVEASEPPMGDRFTNQLWQGDSHLASFGFIDAERQELLDFESAQFLERAAADAGVQLQDAAEADVAVEEAEARAG
jgi:hypothetical protein